MASPFKDYIVKLRKGDLVFKEGDPGTEMYIVQSGTVEIFSEGPRGHAMLAVMEKGDFFGEMALLDGAPHAASARAMEDAELIEINSTLFDRMIKGNAEIAVRMLRKLSIRLREANRKYDSLLEAAEGGSRAAPPARPEAAPPPAPFEPATATAGPSPFSVTQAPPIEPPPTPAAEPPAPAAVPAPSLPAGCHSWLRTEDGQETFPLSGPRAQVGRFDPVTGLKPEVDLSRADINRSVSRNHARLTLEGGVHYVCEEPGALNGTFVNGRKLITGKPARVKEGDSVVFGMVRLVFHEGGNA